MIRLYSEESFSKNKKIELAKEELKYFRQVRRGEASAELFNRTGQTARGRVEDSTFLIEEVFQSESAQYEVDLAVGLPDAKVLKPLVRSLSELGVRSLFFFVAERSQAGKKRIEGVESLDKIAIEAARQCERARPLEIKTLEFASILEKFSTHQIIVFDEDPVSLERAGLKGLFSADKPVLCLVGPEGGWTSSERQYWQDAGMQKLHLPTPILKVENAAAAAALLCIVYKAGMLK